MKREIKVAMLATKEEYYDLNFRRKPIGSITKYETKRKNVIDKLNPGDLIYIRLQGDGDIKAICQYIKVDEIDSERKNILLKIMDLKENGFYSTKEVFQATGVKAGAECAWMKERISRKWWRDTTLKCL